MKKIIIYSHLNYKNLICQNGDKYDSRIELYDDNNSLIYYTNFVNVDSTGGKKEIQNGVYAGIVGLHKWKYKGILIYKYDAIEKINNWKELHKKENYKYRTLITLKNKNIKFINIHKGGKTWDWSLGCITIYKDYYNKFIRNFEINEKILIFKVSKKLTPEMKRIFMGA